MAVKMKLKVGGNPNLSKNDKKVAKLDKKIARVGGRTNKDGFAPKRTSKLIAKRKETAENPKRSDKRRQDQAASSIKQRAEAYNRKKLPNGGYGDVKTYGDQHQKTHGVPIAGTDMELTQRGERMYDRKEGKRVRKANRRERSINRKSS